MVRYDDPATFRGQLQRGRGSAWRRARAEPGAGAAVYECVISDPRWDRQAEQRDGYLAGLSGAMKLPGIWDGFADEIVASHDDSQLTEAVCACEPWTTFARTQPRIGRLVQDRASARQPARPPAPGRPQIRDARTENLLEDITAGGPARRRALEELGRLGEMVVLDLAQDRGLRNAAGWIPGMPQALHQLGPAAVPRARAWVADGRDSILASFGTRVLAERGSGNLPADR